MQAKLDCFPSARHHREGAIPTAPPHRPASEREGGESLHSAAADDPREERAAEALGLCDSRDDL